MNSSNIRAPDIRTDGNCGVAEILKIQREIPPHSHTFRLSTLRSHVIFHFGEDGEGIKNCSLFLPDLGDQIFLPGKDLPPDVLEGQEHSLQGILLHQPGRLQLFLKMHAEEQAQERDKQETTQRFPPFHIEG